MNNLQKDSKIIELLGLNTLSRIVCDTDKGMLKLQLRKGDNNYNLVLDAVPLDKILNKELMDLLFPVKQMDMPQVNKLASPQFKVDTRPLTETPVIISIKPMGRPKGSKNK